MDQRAIHNILSGRKGGIGAGALRSLLLAGSWPYAAAMSLRRRMYRRGWLSSTRATAPVISVGNITTGGTGKTPMVAWIVEQLKGFGANPAVLIRGYKATEGRSDEAELLKQLTGCPVVVNADRVAAAGAAADNGAGGLVMDDGFQHRRLRRDLDIVLIDATCPFGYGRCLPRGLMREPLSALQDADAIVITRSDAVEAGRLQRLRDRLVRAAPQASLHAAIYKPVKFTDQTGAEMPPEAVGGRAVYAFCGIGNPDSFFDELRKLDAKVDGRCVFDDHVAYTPERIESLRSAAADCDAEILVTTQKDYVKLAGVQLSKSVWQLGMEIEITDGREELIDKLQMVILD